MWWKYIFAADFNVDEMRRIFVAILLLIISQGLLWGQETENMKAIACLLGVEAEELDLDEYERLSDILRRPLQLNTASQAELVSGGFLSRFQVASLMDYRQRCGAVMSYMELSVVDGFDADLVARIRPFISLERPGSGHGGRLANEVLSRISMRVSDDLCRWGCAVRYRVRQGETFSASFAVSRSLGSSITGPDTFCGSVRWKLKKVPVKIVAGDFNARFAQGLNMWSGMYISDYKSPTSFMRRPTGFSASSSMTGIGTYTGVASEVLVGRFTFSTMAAATGLREIWKRPDKIRLVPAANIGYNGKTAQLGLTQSLELAGIVGTSEVHIPAMRTSLDFSACFRGVDVFSELLVDWSSRTEAMIAGMVFPIGEHVDMASMVRLSAAEYALSLSSSLNVGDWVRMLGDDTSRRKLVGTMSADVVLYSVPKVDTQDRSLQLRLHSQWHYALSESLLLTFRVSERMRSWGDRFKTDVRADLSWNIGRWSAIIRANLLKCRETAFLSYVEGNMNTGRVRLHLRQGVFVVDDWEDRIYAYERDAPGCFNVPAFYGRGVWTSVTASFAVSKCVALYIRGCYTSYVFMEEKKPGKAELRFQCMCNF